MNPAVEISIIVCTYNRAEMLRRALESLVRLELDPARRYEIVVVDNASTDATADVIAAVAAAAPMPVRGVYEARQGVAIARNRGLREARGTWIAYFDDDQVAAPGWLAALLEMARQRDVRCVGGPVRLVMPDQDFREAPLLYQKLLGNTGLRKTPLRYSRTTAPATNNLLVHRSVFEEVGAFDETMVNSGEDTDLYRRIEAAGIEGWFTPGAIVYHVLPAYRRTPQYLQWKYLRDGGIAADQDQRRLGRWGLLASAIARWGQAALLHVPRLLWARLRGHSDAVLERRCRLWRCEGYTRQTLRAIAPRLFAQRAYFDRLEFRRERQLFAPEEAPVSS